MIVAIKNAAQPKYNKSLARILVVDFLRMYYPLMTASKIANESSTQNT